MGSCPVGWLVLCGAALNAKRLVKNLIWKNTSAQQVDAPEPGTISYGYSMGVSPRAR